MKKINFNFRLLILIGVLIMGINSAWAWQIDKGNVYFVAPADWTGSVVQLVGNTAGNDYCWEMINVSNTKLYYKYVNGEASSWAFDNWYIMANSTAWQGGDRGWDYPPSATNYTSTKTYNINNKDGWYIFTGSSLSDNYRGTSISPKDDVYLKKDQTVNIEVNGETPTNSPAQIVLASYYLSANPTTSSASSITISKDENTTEKTFTACIGAKVTLTKSNVTSGLSFYGWDNGSGVQSTADSYEYWGVDATTVTAKFENRYTVTVSAGAHGRITSGSPSVSAGYYTNPTITAEAYGDNSDQYRFLKWVCTGGATVASETSATTTVSATAAGTVTAQFVSVWTLKGGNSSSEDDNDALGDWKVFNSMDYTGTSYVYELEIPLEGNTTYQFQLYDYPNSTWYRYGSEDYQLAFVGQSTAYNWDLENTAGKQNMVLMTANSGTYTFTYNSNTKRLTVGFPDQSHPNTDNIYFKNSGESPYTNVYAHIWGGTKGSTGGGRLPKLPTCEFDGQTYYYAAIGIDNNKCLFANSEDIKTGSPSKTSDQSDVDEKVGQYYDLASGTWKDFTATLTLSTDQGETTNPSPSTITVTYGKSTNINTDIISTSPAKTGYPTFGGYYTEPGGGGTQVITAGELIPSNLAGYTSSGNWIKKGSSVSATLYAKWTQDITLSQDDADKEGSDKLVATYNAVLDASGISTPKKIGKKFAGWTTVKGSGSVVINASNVVQKNVASWTDSDGKWIHEGASTLYAKWEDDANNFIGGTDENWTTGSNWSKGSAPVDEWYSVIINQPVTISGTSVHIGQLSFGTNGKLTIAADGALEVAGTISNEDASKLVINSTGSSQGALIFNSTGSTAANVNMTMNASEGKFQFIAIPVSLVSVNPTFAGTGKYTYVWSNKDHTWERRGYYDDIYSFEAVLLKGQGTAEFNGNLVSTGNITYSGSYSSTGYNNVYMHGNSWTAPIKLSAGMYDNVSIGIMKGTNNSWDGGIVNDVIPALQAFGVAVGSGKATGSFTINYDTDVRNPSYPNEPLRVPQRQTADVRPIAIYVSGNDMQTRIRLLEDATRFTDDLDAGWEAYYLAGQGLAGEMYAVGPEAKMNVLATPNLEGTVVGFVPGQATDYTISFTGDGKGYYLNDIATGESTLIDEANTYNFKSDEDTNATRFVVSKMPLMPTGVDEVADGSKARKQMIDGTLYIIRDGRIYKVDGALVK